jgi:hypothetical protein
MLKAQASYPDQESGGGQGLGLLIASDWMARCTFTETSHLSDIERAQYTTKGDPCQSSDGKPALLTAPRGCAILQNAILGWEEPDPLRLRGLILQQAYRLRRHLWGDWPLANWLGLLILVGGLASAMAGGLGRWLAPLFGMLFLGYLILSIWARRRGYVEFRAGSPAEQVLDQANPNHPLRAEEWVPVRASGWFTVEGKNQYYMDLEADFETVETREHIVLGRVHPSRLLWLGRWPAYELGWWYIFFKPAMIRAMSVGQLHFGRRPRLALQVAYAPDEETLQTLYLAFDDAQALRRVWDDLLQDVPAGATVAVLQSREE